MTVCERWPAAINANISKSEKGSVRAEAKGEYDLRAEMIF
jgi:hypothetical protein